jgi:hypothetical protein
MVGESVIVGTMDTVAVAEPPLSVAFNIWFPWVTDGMVNTQLKEPLASLLTVAGDVVKLTSSKEIVTILGGPASKPLPAMLTMSPAPPVTGDTIILELTANCWVGTPETDVKMV